MADALGEREGEYVTCGGILEIRNEMFGMGWK